MAGAAGIEPANHGIKTRCLTTWLRPKQPVIKFFLFYLGHEKLQEIFCVKIVPDSLVKSCYSRESDNH